MQISVIIPVFKVEQYIERCVQSLMKQSFPEIEFIFINDGTPDRSIDIIRQVTANYNRTVRIITHSENKGLPAARNTGLNAATGDWILHCDADDWMESTMIEKLYTAAKEANADLAYCDFFLDFGDSRKRLGNPSFSDGKTMVRDGYLAGTTKYNVWNKLVRASLYQDLLFPEGHAMGEDMTMIPVTARATRVVHVPDALYHYFKLNPGAYSNTFSEKNLNDVLFNVNHTFRRLSNYHFPKEYIAYFKLNTKLPFLLSGDTQQYRLWKEWFPEANRFIWHNHHLPIRTRFVQLFAAKNLFPLVSLYSFVVNRLHYGLISKKK